MGVEGEGGVKRDSWDSGACRSGAGYSGNVVRGSREDVRGIHQFGLTH